MEYCMITFRSVTPAQRAEELLRLSGIGCSIQRTPRWMEELGCGYSLRLRRSNARRALDMIRANGISCRKIYLRRMDGSFEELNL